MLARLLLVITQGIHQGWELHVWCSGSQNAGGQKKQPSVCEAADQKQV